MPIAEYLLTDVVIVQRRTVAIPDDYGMPVVTFVATEEQPGYLRQLRANELIVLRDTPLADWDLLLRPGATVDAGDRVQDVATGKVFEVVGAPGRPTRADGEHHVRVHLRYSADLPMTQSATVDPDPVYALLDVPAATPAV